MTYRKLIDIINEFDQEQLETSVKIKIDDDYRHVCNVFIVDNQNFYLKTINRNKSECDNTITYRYFKNLVDDIFTQDMLDTEIVAKIEDITSLIETPIFSYEIINGFYNDDLDRYIFVSI